MSNHDEVFDPTQDGLEEAPVYRQYTEGKYLVKFTLPIVIVKLHIDGV